MESSCFLSVSSFSSHFVYRDLGLEVHTNIYKNMQKNTSQSFITEIFSHFFIIYCTVDYLCSDVMKCVHVFIVL